MPKAFVSLRGNRWLKRCLWALVGLLLLWAVAWVAVPPLVRWQIQRMAPEQLGREVTVGRVDFSPWTLELEIHDLAVASADRHSTQFGIQRLYIDAELQSLVRMAPVVDALQIDAPVLKLTQLSPGHYDIDDILARLSARSDPGDKAAPLQFALYNIALAGGAVDFDDKVQGRVHTLRQAGLMVPFLSNLATHRTITVTPQLAFTLNGSAFESSAQATPFADDHKAEVHLQVQNFDLLPFAGYLPDSVPLKWASGALSADLHVTFEQMAEAPSIKLSGSLGLNSVKLADGRQQELLAFDALQIRLRDVQPLKKLIHLESLEWSGVHAEVRRNASGALELPGVAVNSSPGAATAETPATADRGSDWQFTLGRIAVRDSALGWTDAGVTGAPARLTLQNLNLEGADIAWPMKSPLSFRGHAELGNGNGNAARLAFQGEATDRHATVAATVRQLQLQWASPYMAPYLVPQVRGTLDADVGLAWNGPALVAKVARLSMEGNALVCPARGACPSMQEVKMAGVKDARSLVELQRLDVADALVELHKRKVVVGRIALAQPRALVSRTKAGRWMFEDWLVTDRKAAMPASTSRGSGDEALPWDVQLADLSVDGGAVALRDTVRDRTVELNLSEMQIRMRGLAPLATNAQPAALTVSTRVASGRIEPGSLRYEGTLGVSPVAVQGRIKASHLPLHALEPYVADQLNVRILRADGSFAGDVRHVVGRGGASTTVRGDAALDEVRVRSVAGELDAGDGTSATSSEGGEELLNWKSLGLRGVEIAVIPGKPVSIEVKETSLSDFFARIIVNERGHINLQDIRKAAATEAGSELAQAPVAVPGEQGATDPVIRFGPVVLTGGAVRFTDNFVKPNYSADLSALSGRLSAFASEVSAGDTAPQMAELELRGKAEGSASLEIAGRFNPLAKPLALDIQGHMRDLELPPLSPYSIKYAGHGIERGKLSMDVTYRVLPNGQLTASNKLVLNQLVFGDSVEGAPASLPVQLAVALLADRNGVIDVELPISGSLNDPQFRVGPVILRAIGNLVMKAVTAPFSLLASAFGGGDGLGSVNFAPGSSALTGEAQQGLDKVAQALLDRPALQMTVVGAAQLEAEREAWKRQRLQSLVVAQKRRTALRADQAADASVVVSDQEYPELLKEVYRRTDMSKPRNLIGMAKDVSVAEMEALLLAHIVLPDNAMRELALARSVAVRDYLAAKKVPLERLFIGAVRVAEAEGGKWVPRAQLTLGPR